MYVAIVIKEKVAVESWGNGGGLKEDPGSAGSVEAVVFCS